jgi:orotidine-5'-phosphate decarboxylase
MNAFLENLDWSCQANESLVCLGLDPELARIPTKDIVTFNKGIVEATCGLVGAYKPNLAFYEALGLAGFRALEETIRFIREVSDTMIVIGDGKRGDIGHTAAAYAKGMFDNWGFDAVTVNVYGGEDSVVPFLNYSDKGVFVWCRSSNPGASDFQDLEIKSQANGQIPFYKHVAYEIQDWNKNGNAGLVMGATYPDQIRETREICPDMPFLIPGIGSQDGALDHSVRNGISSAGRRILINSSRGLIYADGTKNFAKGAREATRELRDNINAILDSLGLPW